MNQSKFSSQYSSQLRDRFFRSEILIRELHIKELIREREILLYHQGSLKLALRLVVKNFFKFLLTSQNRKWQLLIMLARWCFSQIGRAFLLRSVIRERIQNKTHTLETLSPLEALLYGKYANRCYYLHFSPAHPSKENVASHV